MMNVLKNGEYTSFEEIKNVREDGTEFGMQEI